MTYPKREIISEKSETVGYESHLFVEALANQSMPDPISYMRNAEVVFDISHTAYNNYSFEIDCISDENGRNLSVIIGAIGDTAVKDLARALSDLSEAVLRLSGVQDSE